jgi:mRNA interferase RelE/StbE
VSWKIDFTGPARRDLRRLDRQTAARVVAALERFAATRQGDVIRLTATEPEWRLRVGDWRVRFVYDFEQQVILVERIRHRSQAYRD